MRTMLCAFAMLAVTTVVHAEVPTGPDAINGAFTRMFEHESATTMSSGAAVGEASDFLFERWVNATARGEMSSLEAGFVHMLQRCADTPHALVARGEPDPLAVMVAATLQAQQRTNRRPAPERLAAADGRTGDGPIPSGPEKWRRGQ